MNMWHGQHAGAGINAPTSFTGIEVGARVRFYKMFLHSREGAILTSFIRHRTSNAATLGTPGVLNNGSN